MLPLASGVLNPLAVAGQNRPLLLVVDGVHGLDRVSAQALRSVGGQRLSVIKLGASVARATSGIPGCEGPS